MTLKLNHTLITIAAYCPPKHKITPMQFENVFNSLGHYFKVGDDLNAKNQTWDCYTSNPKGHALLQIINQKNIPY